MSELLATKESTESPRHPWGTVDPWGTVAEVLILVVLFFTYAGDAAPMVNEAHYLVKAKNFWNPDWCANDLFASSGKAHTVFYWLFGWPTLWVSLDATAWIGRFIGWFMIAIGLQRLCRVAFSRLYLSPLVAVVWIAGVEYGNLAGEWVIGGIEAKVPAYGFVLLALSFLLQRRWDWVWPLLGAASAFHVLAGGWSVVAAFIAWWFIERKEPERQSLIRPSLFLGGAISLFGLLPSLALSIGNPGGDATYAAQVYTYYRLPHHLLPAAFQTSWYIRFSVLLGLGTFVTARSWRSLNSPLRRFIWFTVGAIVIMVLGFLMGILPAVAPNAAAKLLRFYWFRLSDAIVPLALGLIWVATLMEAQARSWQKALAVSAIVASLVGVAVSAWDRAALGVPPSVSHRLLGWVNEPSPEVQQRIYRDWVAVCQWAERSSAPGDVFITPRHQQTFKWYSNRAEVVNWKDVPQDVPSLIQWRIRFNDIFPRRLGRTRTTIQYDLLRKIHERYGPRWMIVDRRIVGPSLPLVQVYPTIGEENETFAVYALPLDESSD